MNKVSEILNNSLKIKCFPKVHIVFEEVGPSGQVENEGRVLKMQQDDGA